MTGRWSRTPLRIKLVAALLALVAGALALAGLAAATSLRSYLMKRVDQQLGIVARSYRDPVRDGGPGGPGGPGAPGDRGPRELGPQYYVYIADGTPETLPAYPRPKLPIPTTYHQRQGYPFTVGTLDGHGSWRVIVVPRRDGSIVYVARSLADENGTVTRLVLLEAIIGLTVLVLLGGLGYVVVRRSLRPLEEVETTAAAIAAGDLSRRVPESDERTEVGRLATAFNSMLTQIESAFRVRAESEAAARKSEERMRRFVTDASHELRTPLTSIRGFAELYRQGAVAGDELPRLMRRIEDEGARMGLLVDDLLMLARLDQERPLARDVVDLLPLATDAVHDAQAVDPSRTVTLGTDGAAYDVVGDESRLRQVLANLVGNALKHTPAGTPVEVRLSTADGQAVLEVVDHGPGLAPEDAERVFERFYRADPSRARSAGKSEGGSGLGLAIVAALAEAHGGSVSVDTSPGKGATFRVRLPLADERSPLRGAG